MVEVDYNHRRDNSRYDSLGWLYDKFKRYVRRVIDKSQFTEWTNDALYYTVGIVIVHSVNIVRTKPSSERKGDHGVVEGANVT